MKYQAALFDMDGVILDSEPLHLAAFRATLLGHGYSLSDEDYKQHFAGRTDEAGFKSYFDFVNESVELPVVMDKKARAYLELAKNQLVAYPGVAPLVRELAERMPLALVTGSLRLEAEAAMEALGLTDSLKVIVAAEDVEKSKPDPEGYLTAARLLGIDPAHCVVVEDAPKGIQAALAVGMDCIAVTNTHTAKELSSASVIVGSLSPSLF